MLISLVQPTPEPSLSPTTAVVPSPFATPSVGPLPTQLTGEIPKVTDWMQAWGTIGGAVLAVLAVVLTGLLLRHEVRAARKAHEMAEEEIRPYVIVDFDFRSILALLVIQNIGKSIAHDVEISFDPPLASSTFDFDEVQALKQPIPMIAPGRRIPFFFDSITDRKASPETPMSYRVSIKYRDSAGKPYIDPTYILDLQTFMGSAVPPAGITELADRVKDIRDEMRKWTLDRALGVRAIDHYADTKRRIKALKKRREALQAQQEQARSNATDSMAPENENSKHDGDSPV